MRHRSVRFRSSSQRSPDALLGRLFLGRSPPRLLNAAAPGGLKPAPASRLREAFSHLQYSITGSACVRDTHHSLPFFVWCMSSSRLCSAFLVDDGALMIVASTMVPERIS